MSSEKDYIEIMDGNPLMKPREYIMKDSSAVLPESVPAGSVAYTADLTYMAMFDGSDWVEIGGGD